MKNSIIEEDVDNICQEKLPWNELAHKKVFITGARSYIANYIIRTLCRLNDRMDNHTYIYALCRDREKSRRHFGDLLDRDDFKLVCQDVCMPIDDKYRSHILIHAASTANPKENSEKPTNVVLSNVQGFSNVLYAARNWKSEKVLLFSSGSVYGVDMPKSGAGEDYRGSVDFVDLKSCYRLSKQMSEMLGRAAIKEWDIDVRVARPFIVYGPGASYSSRKHFTDFLKNVLYGEDIELKSDGSAVRSFCYLKDTVKGIFYILLKGVNGGGIQCNGRTKCVQRAGIGRIVCGTKAGCKG